MGAIRRYFKPAIKDGFPIIFSYFAWMRKYAKHPEKYPFMVRQNKVKNLAYKTALDMNIDFIIEGKENVPDTASLICCNHLSMMDPMTMVSIMDKPTSYISKKENATMPFIGKVMLDLEGEFIDRDDLKQTLKVMMNIQKDLEKGTKNWVIFPDGTRNKDPMKAIGEFHHGSFRPAVKANVPIVPVAFFGTQGTFSKKHCYKKYPVFVKFLKPIMPEEYAGMNTQDIANMVHERIQRTVSFELRKKYNDYMSQYKDFRFNQM